MTADLIGVGQYNHKLIGHLDYPPQYYKDTEEGVVITRELFGIYEGSSTSREFASFLGITNTWDFAQHKIDADKIDFKGLKDFCCNRYTDYDEDYESFVLLINNGFQFHFRPNG